jgi:chromate reductase
MRILTLCGSLRAQSSNRAILQAYERVAGEAARFRHYEGLGALPHFNPDLDGLTVPAEVTTLRALIASADAIVISTPEYAHALPGTFKNALDWLVSDPAFVGKPVAILQAARGSSWAADSLREVLTTMSAQLIDSAGVQLALGSNRVGPEEILARADLRTALTQSFAALAAACTRASPPGNAPVEPWN